MVTLLAIAKESFAHSEEYPEEDSFSMSQDHSSHTQAQSYSQLDSNGRNQFTKLEFSYLIAYFILNMNHYQIRVKGHY